MRVAIAMFSPGIGGTERRVADLLPRLRAAGCDATLLTNDSLADALRGALGDVPVARLGDLPGSLCTRLSTMSIPLISPALRRTACYYGLGLVVARRFGPTLRTLKPDVLHLILSQAFLAHSAQPYAWRYPTVASLVGTDVRDLSFLKDPLDYCCTRSTLCRAAHVDVLSEELMVRLQSFPWAKSLAAQVLLPAVDTDADRPSEAKSPLVAFAGRLVWEKNPLLFVEACAEVISRTDKDDVRFCILGRGPLESAVRRRISELGLQSRVSLGFVDSCGSVLSRSLIFTSLQRRENYPSRSLLEAMACGNAIVATDVGHTARLVHERTGIRVPAEAGAVAHAICQLLESRDQTLELGRNARRVVEAGFSWDRYVARLLDTYKKVARNGSHEVPVPTPPGRLGAP